MYNLSVVVCEGANGPELRVFWSDTNKHIRLMTHITDISNTDTLLAAVIGAAEYDEQGADLAAGGSGGPHHCMHRTVSGRGKQQQ